MCVDEVGLSLTPDTEYRKSLISDKESTIWQLAWMLEARLYVLLLPNIANCGSISKPVVWY